MTDANLWWIICGALAVLEIATLTNLTDRKSVV